MRLLDRVSAIWDECFAQVVSVPVGMVFGEATYRVVLVFARTFKEQSFVKWTRYVDGMLVTGFIVAIPLVAASGRFKVT